MALTPYTSQQPVDDFSLRFADIIYSVTLSPNTDVPLTIPGSAPSFKMVVKASSEAWMAQNTVALLPGTAPFAQKGSEMINAGYVVCREVAAKDVIHFISAAAVDVNVMLYALRTNN